MENTMIIPETAQRKLTALEQSAIDLQGLAEAARVGLQRLGVDHGNLVNRWRFLSGDLREEEAAAVEAELVKIGKAIDEAQDEHGRRRDRAAAAQRVHVAVMTWLKGLRPDTALEAVAVVDAKARRNEPIADAIIRTRQEILEVQHELGNVKTAPMSRGEAEAAIRHQVEELAARGRPTLDTVGGNFNLRSWRTADVAGVLSWLFRDRVIEALTAQLGDDAAAGLSAADRAAARTKELKTRLDGLERQEEMLVVQALGEGVACDRRPDASPACVLGVKVVKSAKIAKIAA
jgi:hypothetical protein